jgi:eukaryotic-like serine/threonine-protein kinase
VPLTVGTRIGVYEILSPLGEGAMGVVFRARDTKLGRDVAIKALPDPFATDSDRLARFEGEARILAALNHANIAHIYGIEESHETRCIVMELVEGETLAQKLKRGPLRADEALAMSGQILQALEAAHEKGIVHRDLKPGNVMVLSDGNVKVLDFGLAKALESTPAGAGLSHSPTLSLAATQAGVILGTAAYMSPEQAKGLSADARSDVFSFGCVLYEMLAGRQVFQGETAAEVLASVLVRDPDFKLLPPDLNPRFYDVLRRCLEKNPKRRWHTAADLRIELESIAADVYRKPEIAQPFATPRRSRERLAWLIAAAAILMAIAIPVFLYFRVVAPGRDSSIVRFEIDTPSQGLTTSASPDGKRVLASTSAIGPLWVRTLEHLNAQILQGTEGASSPFWSPDGRYIASPNTRGGSWSRDGVILAGNGTGQVARGNRAYASLVPSGWTTLLVFGAKFES